ncbi:hypothetical protein IH574_01960, partial [Candidatus Bathyarchaeota archaeon]|nr:hypothetical protein [Candidatus Bathyarchaeota archaeon]
MKGNLGKPLAVIALVLLLAFSVYQKQRSLGGKEAVIVDQLSGENTGFVERCSGLLEPRGYSVRVFKGENVTIGLFQGLDWRVALVVLRMHSGVFDDRTWLFTHEKYDSSKYVLEQLSGEADIGVCGSVDYPVFTVSSDFFKRNLEFDGGLVIVMGCNGLDRDDLGRVLYETGAGAVVGWNTPVTVEETDEAVYGFLEEMLS